MNGSGSRRFPPTETPQSSPRDWQPTYLQGMPDASGLLGRWYRLAAWSPSQDRILTLKEQEVLRRSRLASLILAVQLLFIELPVIPVVANAPNHSIVLPALFGCILALCIAFLCNRQGALLPAGLLMVASIEITVGVKIWTVPGGISVFYLPQFDILIQPILIAVALLAPWSAFAVALLNSGFFVTAMLIGPHAADLTAALRNPIQVGDLFAVPIMGQILTAFFGWIIVKNLLEALKRASRAEQIAELEHTIAQDQAAFRARNQELEQGVAAIIQTIQAIANQGRSQPIALPTSHVLWPVAQQLTHFLDRYQRARGAEALLDLTSRASTELATALQQAAQERHPVQFPPLRGTPLDSVLYVLSEGKAPRLHPSGPLTRPANNAPPAWN